MAAIMFKWAKRIALGLTGLIGLLVIGYFLRAAQYKMMRKSKVPT